MLAFLSGIADVDPINLTLAKMSKGDLSADVAVFGILIATATNTLVKAGLTGVVGGKELFIRVFAPLLLSATGGLITLWLLE